jgi:hypothetical protein
MNAELKRLPNGPSVQSVLNFRVLVFDVSLVNYYSKIVVFWDATPFILMWFYRRFGGTCFLNIHWRISWRRRHHTPPYFETSVNPTGLHDVTSQKTAVFRLSPPEHQLSHKCVDFEVLTAVIMKAAVFWRAIQCNRVKDRRRFGGT